MTTSTSTQPAPLLTAAEEDELARAIEAGVLAAHVRAASPPPSRAEEAELCWVEAEGRHAWTRFVQANLGLVRVFAVREARRCQLPEPDFFQEGCVALMLALQRFDHRRGVRFSSYAVPWIRAAVSRAGASRCGEVDLPSSRAEAVRRARAAQSWLAVDLGRMPSAAEVGVSLDREAVWVQGLLAYRGSRSLDLDDGRPFELPDDEGEHALEQVLTIGSGAGLLDGLPLQERRVLALRFGFAGGRPHSLREASERLGIGRKRLRAVEERALQRLRRRLGRSAAA